MVPTVGGSISLLGPNYQGYLGAGVVNGGFELGSYAKATLGSYQITAGDQNLAFSLPTDIFGGTEFLTTRGAGVMLPGSDHVFLFAGATTLPAGSPIFQAFQDQTALAVAFVDKQITPNFHFYSRNILSHQQTWIEGFDWQVRQWLKAALSGGMGSNKPYFAVSLDANRAWYEIKAGYIEAGNGFRRITTPTLFASEPDRENILVTLKPFSSFVLNAGHENFLAPQGDLSAPFERASVDQLQTSFDVAKFRLGAGLFESHNFGGRSVSDGFTVSRSITRNVDGSVSYYQNLSGLRPHTSYLISTVRETISPKISVLEVLNRTPGNTSFLFGGSYTTNRLSINVDYQTLYMPFLANPLVTGIGITLQLKLWGGLQLNGNTFRSPDGKLRYTAYMSGVLTPHLGLARSGEAQAPKLGDYVVRGHVRSEQGTPIAGAAILLGDQTVYSNEAGEFLLRQNKARPMALTVLTEEFLSPFHFTVVSAPPTVTAASEESAADVLIVLRPVTNNPR